MGCFEKGGFVSVLFKQKGEEADKVDIRNAEVYGVMPDLLK